MKKRGSCSEPRFAFRFVNGLLNLGEGIVMADSPYHGVATDGEGDVVLVLVFTLGFLDVGGASAVGEVVGAGHGVRSVVDLLEEGDLVGGTEGDREDDMGTIVVVIAGVVVAPHGVGQFRAAAMRAAGIGILGAGNHGCREEGDHQKGKNFFHRFMGIKLNKKPRADAQEVLPEAVISFSVFRPPL